jgi:hypothetical protein
MYAACILISPTTLRRIYVEQLRTTDQVAAHFGCSGTTVLRHLRRFQIPVRPPGPCVDWVRLRKGLSPTVPGWSADVAYVIGLIATDGNLGRKRPVIGLTPAKSLTLGPLSVPDEYFADFFRGCIDGDGTMLVYTDRTSAMSTNASTCPSSRRAGFHRKAADERLSANRHQWIDGSAAPRARSFRLETSVRQSAVNTTARVDVLCARRSLSWSQTRKGRTISLASPGPASRRPTG